ncbi:hypothetical protein [Streptomyces sp. NBRC 109706]|uniref:hypothetical protein n=1 Tax=Streptomyces sp. NBRC 109706 TaxID=1550035 RepID=UPI001F488D5C|nr:hypothetical protein [Streptomyces sp. NBRC 109706]
MQLPTLYADCHRETAVDGVRVIRKAPRKSAAANVINPAAAEIRSTIRKALASWAGLVAEERRLPPPARDMATLAHFLGRHIEWLCRHPAAGELADEIRELTRRARDIAYPNDMRRVPIGSCPDDGCPGELVALMRHRDARAPSEIVCSVSPDHSWPATRWTGLARRIRTRQGERA